MALTPKDPDTFYREVDEELRRDQLTKFGQRYGVWLGGAVLLFLVAVAGLLWWQNHRQAQAEKSAEELQAVFEDISAAKLQGIDGRLDKLADEGGAGVRASALLTKGDLALAANKDAEAVAAFKKVAEDDAFAQPFRDAALVRQTAAEFDKLPPAQVVDRLKPLAASGNPWFGSAGEMVAMAYLKQNKPQLAAPIFQAMAQDPDVPQSIRSRAVQMAGSLGVDAAPAPAKSGAGATKEASR